MSSSVIVQQFVIGLKSRNQNVQNKAAHELLVYVKTELREMSQEELSVFFEVFNHHIFEMIASSDISEKKGGVLAINCLIGADIVNTTTRISRYFTNLRNLLTSNDVGVVEIAARTLVKLACLPGSKGTESFDFEIKRAFEWLSAERHEYRRHAAVLILRELALAMPTYFYQSSKEFFSNIFFAIFDSKPAIRESACEALRAALIVVSDRESTKQSSRPHCYRTCYEKMMKGFDALFTPNEKDKYLTRDDCISGGLMVLNELLRCSNASWEKKYTQLKNLQPELRKHYHQQSDSHFTLVPKFIEKLGVTQSHSETENSIQKFSSVNIHESESCRQILMSHYKEICDVVMENRTSKSIYVQQAIALLLPRLAAFKRDVFVKEYLSSTIAYLLRVPKRTERYSSHVTIGFVAVAVEIDIERYIKPIMDTIKAALPAKDVTGKKKTFVDPAIFSCITLMSFALKSKITEDIREILDQMLSTGLSPALTVCLRELSENIPQLKVTISKGVINMLPFILMEKVPINYGTGLPPGYVIGQKQQFLGQENNVQHDIPTIVLALKTLGNFNFDDQNMLDFVQRCADFYINHDSKEVRMEAVQTCTTLLKAAITQSDAENSKALKETVSHVLEKLLIVAVTDVDYHVRLRVLRCLDETFDPELAQPESLSALMITLHDEIFEIRELAIITIGRLSSMNVAYIIPSLRKTLIQLLIELEHSGMSRNKEQSARMLDHLIVSTPRLISFYMHPILKILVSKLRESDTNPGVLLNVLRAIGDLAEVNGGSNEMEKWADELLKILLEMLSDLGNPDKRGVALWTLGQIVSATGRVVTPYYKYPNLIDILINFLKTETRKSIRLRTIRVLGLLGAMDPYKHKMNKGLIDYQNDNILISISDFKDEDTMDVSTGEMLVDVTSFDEYYPAVALQTLIKILRDQTLSHLHTNVVQAITFTCQSLGIKCVRYLPQVLPNLLENIRLAEMKDREFLIQQLSNIIEIVKQHIISYMKDIFKLIKEFWTPNSPLQSTFINLIEKIAVALGCEFRNYFSQLIPQILRVLHHDVSKDRHLTVKLLKALQKFGEILEDYLNLIIPPIVKLFDGPDIPQPVTVAALETIENLAYILNFTDFSSRIIHPLIRVLDHNSDIREQALSTLKALVVQLGKKYLVFVPLVGKVFAKHKIVDVNYEKLLNNAQEKTTMWLTEEFLAKQARYKQAYENAKPSENSNPIKDLTCSEQDLKEAFEITPRVSRDDWVEWLKRLSIGLLKQSPSPALRSCKALAQNHDKLLRDLFNAAFISCWQVLSEPQRKDLTHSLIQALEVKDIPEITQTILNLAEFMEHCDKNKLPISTSILGTRAMDCRAYAKALHYKEDEFKEKKDPQVFEALILINTKLQQKEAAEGLLTSHVATEIKVQGQWYEKLHKYDKAVQHYREQLDSDPLDLNSRIGLMQCLGALGEWSELADIARNEWDTLPPDGKSRAGRLAAVSSWGLQNWEEMQEYVRCIPEDTQDGCFYRAVIAVNDGEFEKAQRLIDETRDLLDTELTSMAGESYERAYGAMVCVQMLTELEEVVQYKLVPERRETIKRMWWNRLQGGQHSVEDWRRIIQVHSLVLTPHEDMHTWLKYASLCRKNNSLKLSHNTLVMLLGTDPKQNPNENLPINQPNVSYAYTKHMAKEGDLKAAYGKLSRFVANYGSQFKDSMEMDREDKRILARCYMRLGRWKTNLCGIKDPESIECILQSYQKATSLDEGWYKAWHHWAYTNFSILQDKKQKWADNPEVDPTQIISTYAVSAVEGFYHSIHLSKGNSLQDTLRLLTLWFDFGENNDVYHALLMYIKKIEIDTWLQVIPQLIARIDTKRSLVRELVHELLKDIGKFHPQASVYPLTVASKSASINRKNAADKILQSMRKHSLTLVEQAIMCSDELIRVAILWHEQWHEGLEEASRLYFGDNNAKGMFDILEPLHAMLERGPQTLKETSFAQAYGRELTEAREWCERYQNSNSKRDIDQAWDIYYHVFRKISKQLPQLTSLELPYVSPKLMECRDLELAVPGSYNPGKELIKISFIQKNLAVITSKQRPRKLFIRGSNGKDYIFLLKGHEDLRQDERVMQLFGLVNTLLQNDPETFRRNLTIQRYAVIPLSTNSGLIGWVPHCDTLHTLIRDYRDRDKKTYLNMEHRLMLKKAPDYDHLTLMQKVEVFESALEQTRGDDLAKLLWLKSPSSEVWFERRTNYTRSLAVMSMVGYILGLGDRHPSNLMLDRMSGKILHIDFGDCFEVAMTREKFPEKIPFRLTRMLINAMEVTGIEGTYRKTCESVMCVLRHNKDSLMAVLEAFVYDPLLNWRLLDNVDKSNRSKNTNPSNDVISENGLDNEGMSLSNAHNKQMMNTADPSTNLEVTNKRAKIIVERVQHKLTGNDFPPTATVDVQKQVDLLIQQATNNENLCQCYIGWCPFW